MPASALPSQTISRGQGRVQINSSSVVHSRRGMTATIRHVLLLKGFYLVPGPPHPTVRCDDRTATWQIWVPAAELTLLTHYSACSLPSRILAVLEIILQQLRGRTSRQALGGFGLPATRNQVRPSVQLTEYRSFCLATFAIQKAVDLPVTSA